MKNGWNKGLKLFLVLLIFGLAFVFLINTKEHSGLADITDSPFQITTLKDKRLVARDMKAIFPKYYVVYFNSDDTYLIHGFNYYETESQYRLEFNRLLGDIIDYNPNNNMIRYIYTKGIGSYEDVLNELSLIVQSNNLQIYK